jgi:hypothetical protein
MAEWFNTNSTKRETYHVLGDGNVFAGLFAVARLLDASEGCFRGAGVASVHANHAGLEVLEQSPGAVDVLREVVCCRVSHLPNGHPKHSDHLQLARPILVLFACFTASSSVSNANRANTGANVSSLAINISLLAPVIIVGSKKYP